jgi:myo-inositol-1(or 4)-monophosphatase
MSTPSSIVQLLDPVVAIVRDVAEREIMPRYLRVTHSRKGDGSLLTDADIAAQEALSAKLRAALELPVLGEEMTEQRQAEQWLTGESGLWCIDPIDGTSNFVNGLAHFAVSVALMRAGRSVLGVVFDPVSQETFCAVHGHGAFLNGERLPVRSSAPALRAALAGIDFKRIDRELVKRLAASPPYRSQRNYGASTLDWCYAAAGRFDIYLHGGQRLWDYAAGALIMQEAGGQLCSLEHDDFWAAPLWRRSAVAALDPGLFEAWKTWLRSAAGTPMVDGEQPT